MKILTNDSTHVLWKKKLKRDKKRDIFMNFQTLCFELGSIYNQEILRVGSKKEGEVLPTLLEKVVQSKYSFSRLLVNAMVVSLVAFLFF